jgi:broad-specificity NMP kinase
MARAEESRKRSAAELVAERIRLKLARATGEKIPAGALQAIEKRLKGPEGAFRTRVHDLFKLDAVEADALDSAVAVAVEPALGPAFAELQGQPGRMLPTLVSLRLIFGHGPEPVLRPTGPLLAWGLVRRISGRPGEPDLIEADPEMVDWFHGRVAPDGLDGIAVVPARPPKALPEWQVGAVADRIRRMATGSQAIRVTVTGLPGSGRSTMAATIVEALGGKAIYAEAAGDAGDLRNAFRRVQRLALLSDLTPVWRGEPVPWPIDSRLAPLQFVVAEAGAEPGPRRGLLDLVIPVPPLGAGSLSRLTRAYLPDLPADATSPLGSPRLADLADAAAQKIESLADFRAMLHLRTRERTRGIGRIVDIAYGWDDLVLPPRTLGLLRGVEQEARLREGLLATEERGRVFERAARLTVLMSGPPGTGKSMSAQVLAGALGLELMAIDMASTVSKYIGETAKNLSAAFAAARASGCAMIFEEADSLFARRTEADSVNARHANADTGHLLQLIDEHDGLVILATNRRANIDSAFLRRMRFVVEFPQPEAEQRRLLWDKMLAALGLPPGLRDTCAAALAAEHELSPAQIKGAALSAAYLAAARGEPIGPADLAEGVGREFLKEGRLASVVAANPVPARRAAHG